MIDNITDMADYIQCLFLGKPRISGYYQEILLGRVFLAVCE